MKEGENQPQHKEIDKQLARARRLDYRKEFQTWPHHIPIEITPLDEAEDIIASKQSRERRENEEQALERLKPEERERHDIVEGLDDLKRSRTMSHKINRALHYRGELLGKMQQYDPEFMNPILTGIKKRPARQAKAESAIERRGIDPGIADYGDYSPLWERF